MNALLGNAPEPSATDDAETVSHASTGWHAALTVMFASGFASLGLQIVWTEQAGLWLGHEATAVLAVVTAFFSGLALGASTLGARIDRSARPERWYAGCEAMIAMWSMALAVLLRPFAEWVLALSGPQAGSVWQWTTVFGGTFLILLPATTAMGATLPAMERVSARLKASRSSIAGLYAANTLGATIGVLATALCLVPSFGLVRTAGICAVCNVVCALATLRIGRPEAGQSTHTASVPARPQTALRLLLAATGFLGIGYEVLVVRVLSQVTEDTVYTYAILLAIYLVGTALGAALLQHVRRGPQRFEPLQDRLLWLLGAACLIGAGSLWAAELLRDGVQRVLGGGMASALTGETLLAVAAFALPTIAMGALFSDVSDRARAAGVPFSRSLAVNTLGAAAAPIVFGAWLVPACGAKLCLVLVAAGYLLLIEPRRWLALPVVGLIGVNAVIAFGAPALAFIDVPPGGHIVSYREGALAAVSVVEDAAGVARLRINNRQQEGDSASVLADARQALLPILLHPDPHRALFLGLGTGTTAAAAAHDPALQVDAVELLPEVIEASASFRQFPKDAAAVDRLHLIAGDARRYVRSPGPLYDVIVADNFHPARSGSGALYTVEHFQAVRSRLAPGGLFCQWLPLHQIDLPTLRSIVRAFVAANPKAFAVLATNSLQTPVLGLIAHRDGERFDLPGIRGRLHAAEASLEPSLFGFVDDLGLLGSFVAGPAALTRFASGATLNTDDRPVVAYLAPRLTYAPDSLPRDRLLAVLNALTVAPVEVVDDSTDAGWSRRLAAYWSARDRFIAAGRDVQPSPDVHAMLAQVRAPLLAVLQCSPDFRPAYDPLLHMAVVLAHTDPQAALDLLDELHHVQPARSEAATMRRALGGGDGAQVDRLGTASR